MKAGPWPELRAALEEPDGATVEVTKIALAGLLDECDLMGIALAKIADPPANAYKSDYPIDVTGSVIRLLASLTPEDRVRVAAAVTGYFRPAPTPPATPADP